MPTVNDVVREFGPDYLKLYGAKMLPSHLKAMAAMSDCRTEKMGSHLKTCADCAYKHRIFHSCKNRSCPLCFFKQTQDWLDIQQEGLLPTHYFHVIFTLPSQLRAVVKRHQKTLYPVLFKAAAESLQALARDERYVGGKLGIMEVLHTWSGAMIYHPHLHCLIPGVGIAENGEVVMAKKEFLVPVRALSAKFRGLFLQMAREAVPGEDFSEGGDVKKWVVFSKPVETKNLERVLNYLGRYLHRTAISNSSILNIEDDAITFRYKKSTGADGKASWGVMKLKPMEFLRRFLQHVLPKGMAKIRYYGFRASGAKKSMDHVRRTLTLMKYLLRPEEVEKKREPSPLKPMCCPQCGSFNWKEDMELSYTQIKQNKEVYDLRKQSP